MKNFYIDRVKKCIQTSLLLQAILMNFFVFLASQIFFEPEFETNDDNYISSILYGVYGNYDTHLVYMNVFLGKIIKLFLVICPKFPWYTIIQYGCLFISFTALTYLIIKEKERKSGFYFLNYIFLAFFGYECYVKIQYSKTAGVLTLVGVLLIYAGLKLEKINKFKVALGFILALIGSLYRFEIFCMVLPIIGIMILKYAFDCIKNNKFSVFLRFCIFYIPLFVICFLFKIYDTSIYNSSPEWKEYKQFDEDRIELLDYGFPEYDDNREIYQELGISINDLNLYSNWNYADSETFTEEVMETLASIKSEIKLDFDLIKDFFAEFPVKYISYTYFIICVLFFIFWFLNKRKNSVITVVLSILIGLAIEFYFFTTGRYFINRVDISIIMGITIVLLYQIENFNINKVEISIISLILASIFLNGVIVNNPDKSKDAPDDAKEIFDLIEKDKDSIYLVENYTNNDLWTSAYSVWDLPKRGVSDNFYTLGGWRYNTPLTNYILQSYGIDNPYREVVDNSNVYIINDYDIGGMLKHIQEHYSPNAKAQLVKVINGHKFYKIYSQNITLDTEKAEKFGNDIKYKFSIADDELGNSMLQGYVYKEGEDSFIQEVYVGKYNSLDNSEIIYPTVSTEKFANDTLKNGRYSWFMCSLSDMGITDIKNEYINVYLKINNELYQQRVELP